MILSNALVRVKSGGEAVWDWCMELLQYARSQDVGGSASVYVSPSSPKWTLSNGPPLFPYPPATVIPSLSAIPM